MATIRNKKTGEMMEVPDTQLQTYGIQPTAPTMPTAPSLADDTPAVETDAVQAPPPPMKTITGRTLDQHTKALQRARAAGDKAAIKQIEGDFDTEYTYQKDTGSIANAAKDTDRQKVKAEVKTNAEALQKVIDRGRKGELKGDAYKQALQFAAGKMAASAAFGEGGKALTSSEISILAGTKPTIQRKEQSWLDRLTGTVPAETGELVDDEQKLYNKALLAQGFDPEPDKPSGVAGVLSGAKDFAMGMGEEIKDSLLNPMQDISAAAAAQSPDGQNAQASQQEVIDMANQVFARAQQEKDPAEKARLLKVAQDGLAQVGINADQMAGEFSEDINQNEAIRGLRFGSSAAGLAEAPAAIAAAKQVLRHPIASTKAVASSAKDMVTHPVQTAKDYLKNDTSGTLQPFNSVPQGMAINEAVEDTAGTPGTPPNPVAKFGQQTMRQGTDLINSGGSPEYVARQAKKPWLPPQNEVLQGEGIYAHPTKTGKTQATSKALVRYGSELDKAYTNSPATFSTTQLREGMKQNLVENGVPPQDAEAIVTKVTQDIEATGNIQIATLDSEVDAKNLWLGTRWLEKYNPTIKGDPEATAYLKDNSKTITRYLRDQLGEAIPETQAINGKYSALRDFVENDYGFKGGVAGAVDGSFLRPVVTPVKNTLNAAGNFIANPKASVRSYTEKPPGPSVSLADGSDPVSGASAPLQNEAPFTAVNTPGEGGGGEVPFQKLVRDQRTKTGNVQFKGGGGTPAEQGEIAARFEGTPPSDPAAEGAAAAAKDTADDFTAQVEELRTLKEHMTTSDLQGAVMALVMKKIPGTSRAAVLARSKYEDEILDALNKNEPYTGAFATAHKTK
jgi:hypothetical protein